MRRVVQGRGQEAWPASAQRPLTFTSQEGEQVGFQVTPSATLWPQTRVTIMIKMQRKEGEGRAMEPQTRKFGRASVRQHWGGRGRRAPGAYHLPMRLGSMKRKGKGETGH